MQWYSQKWILFCRYQLIPLFCEMLTFPPTQEEVVHRTKLSTGRSCLFWVYSIVLKQTYVKFCRLKCRPVIGSEYRLAPGHWVWFLAPIMQGQYSKVFFDELRRQSFYLSYWNALFAGTLGLLNLKVSARWVLQGVKGVKSHFFRVIC